MDSTQEGVLLIATTMIVLVAFGLTVLAVMLIYRKRRLQHQLEINAMNARFAREILDTQLAVQQQTMLKIGEDIHDHVGQQLAVVMLYGEQLLHHPKLRLEDEEQAEKVKSMIGVVRSSVQDLRNLARGLEDQSLVATDFAHLLENECLRIRSSGAIDVEFQASIIDEDPDPTEKSFMFRIFQEFIQNTIKHSGCTRLCVQLRQHETNLELEVRDNGTGFNVEQAMASGKGVGLMNMKRRADMIGAVFSLNSSETGTVLRLVTPLHSNKKSLS